MIKSRATDLRSHLMDPHTRILDFGSQSSLRLTHRPRSAERVFLGLKRNGPHRLVPGEPVTLFPLEGERSVPCLPYTNPRSPSCVVRTRPMLHLLRHTPFP